MSNDNDFDDLVEKLNDGRLTATHVQIAYRAWIRQSPNIPTGIKDLLCGKDGHTSLLLDIFKLASEVVGKMELAYRRGYDAGFSDGKEASK